MQSMHGALAAAVAGDAVANGLAGLGGGEGPVHALHGLHAPGCPLHAQ